MELLFTGRHAVDADITAFEFQPSPALSWEAGQFIQLDLPHNQPDAGGTSRFFTIAAAPHEQVIRIVTRRGVSSFKQRLFELKPGERLALHHAPAGDVTWGAGTDPRTLVAVGVGVTPFYAMLKAQTAQGQLPSTTLVYFHPRTRLPFEAEFRQWQEDHPQLSIHTETSTYTPEQLAFLVPQLRQSTVYLAGPMSPTKLLLPPFNLKPHQIKRDTFTGYSAADY